MARHPRRQLRRRQRIDSFEDLSRILERYGFMEVRLGRQDEEVPDPGAAARPEHGEERRAAQV